MMENIARRVAAAYECQSLLRRFEEILVDGKSLDRIAKRVVAQHLAAPTPQQRRQERRKEKDEFTENNIPAEHLRLWRKLKNQFKGTPDQRAEQFMEYVEAHPGDSEEVLQQHADKEVAKLVREQEKERKDQEKAQRECEKNQDKYEEAWYKEQERATKERQKLKQLEDKAKSVCRMCPTCENNDMDDERVPFAASLRVVAKYKAKKKVKTKTSW